MSSSPTTLSLSSRSPLLRWLRGERRPSAQAIIAAAPVPAEVATLVREVVREVGGTRRERAEIAAELIAHFSDALGSGQSSTEAVDAFGDPKSAARLLRRAVRRRRGFIWRSWWWASRGVAACVALVVVAYAILAARFFLAKPNIAVDYRARIQALLPDVAESRQAWPLYREALAPLRALDQSDAFLRPSGREAIYPLDAQSPVQPGWDLAADALAAHAAQLELLRDAAALPALGLELGVFTPEDEAFYGETFRTPQTDSKGAWSDALIAILLPHLAEMRRSARWLAADARHAAQAGDGARAAADVEAILGVGRQVRGPLLIDQLVSFAILALGAHTAGDLLAASPDAFDARSLAALAAALDSIPPSLLKVSYEGERMLYRDSIQRLYSDNGNGDGHLLSTAFGPEGFADEWGVARPKGQAIIDAAAPALSLIAPSRREATDQFETVIAQSEALAARDPWTWRREEFTQIPDSSSTYAEILRFTGLSSLFAPMPGLESPVLATPIVRLQIDTARLATALLRYRAAHGEWPEDARSLVPEFLSALPTDPYSGTPLRVALKDGSPVIWSVGPDRTDDGMTPIPRVTGRGGLFRFAAELNPGESTGDLVLWPTPREEDAARPGTAVLVR